MKRILLAAALVCSAAGNAFAADAKTITPYDYNAMAHTYNYVCASGLETTTKFEQDATCKFLLALMATNEAAQASADAALERARAWVPPASSELICRAPFRMTAHDGCQ